LNLFRFEEMMHGMPTSSVAPRGTDSDKTAESMEIGEPRGSGDCVASGGGGGSALDTRLFSIARGWRIAGEDFSILMVSVEHFLFKVATLDDDAELLVFLCSTSATGFVLGIVAPDSLVLAISSPVGALFSFSDSPPLVPSVPFD
jgi:hypothetical protein